MKSIFLFRNQYNKSSNYIFKIPIACFRGVITLDNKIIAIAAVAIIVIAAVGIYMVAGNNDGDNTDEGDKVSLTIGGSTTIEPIMGELAKVYSEKNNNVSINVLGGGSGVGASNTANGTFDIGMCSRNLKASEVELGLKETKIALDGVAVIVNGAGVSDLTLEQIAKIFSGEITNWNQVGGNDRTIAVVIRDDSSGTRECFDTAMKGAVDGWTVKSGVPEQSSTNGVISMISSTPGSIGYVSIGALKGITSSSVDAISVNGVEATEENVLNKTYDIQRELVLCTKGDATGPAADFINWILSAEGQKIIAEEFVPLS